MPAAEGGRSTRRSRVALTFLWATATAILLALGVWQLQRLAWKTELIERARRGLALPAVELPAGPLDPDLLDYRRIRVRGNYEPNRAVALGLTTREGQRGARLLAVFRLEDGRVLAVDRGFVPEGQLATVLRAPAPVGSRELEGIARVGSKGTFATPAPDLAVPRWYAPDLEAIGAHLGRALEPVLLVLDTPEPDVAGPPFPGLVAVELANPHLGYAATWFGLAAALCVVYILLVRRPVEGRSP